MSLENKQKAQNKENLIWTDARKEAFHKMIEIKRLKDSNKKIKKKQDNEIKKEILQTSRKQLKEKVKKSNIDELKRKVNIEDEVIEETEKTLYQKQENQNKILLMMNQQMNLIMKVKMKIQYY